MYYTLIINILYIFQVWRRAKCVYPGFDRTRLLCVIYRQDGKKVHGCASVAVCFLSLLYLDIMWSFLELGWTWTSQVDMAIMDLEGKCADAKWNDYSCFVALLLCRLDSLYTVSKLRWPGLVNVVLWTICNWQKHIGYTLTDRPIKSQTKLIPGVSFLNLAYGQNGAQVSDFLCQTWDL